MPMAPKYFLTTQRFGFRLWPGDDVDLAPGLWGDPEVTKLVDARGKPTAARVRERLKQETACAGSHGVQYWPLFLQAHHRHVGCCRLRPYDVSRRILERPGFRYTHAEFYSPTGLVHPCYPLTKEAFRKRRPATDPRPSP